jgi:CubicO group peptidase (beta-lactamase class C family)
MTLSRLAAPILATALATGAPVTGSPAVAQGNADLEGNVRSAFAAGDLAGLHGLYVALDDEVLADLYFPGADERWGMSLGPREHGPDTLHDLRSVTKSIVGLLYGIALSKGLVPSLSEPLIARFPEHADLAHGDRAIIKVRDALSMTMGTEWDESLPYTDRRNSEIAMELAPDRYRFALDRPMVSVPGTRWTYNGGAVALVAKLIADGVGMPIDVYADQVLFGPLGIDTFEWVRGADGVPSAASGLRLSARDLAKIGRMVADGGIHDEERIVPEDWLTLSFTPRAEAEGLRYGYLWWLADWGDPPGWVAGFGNGGQRLTVQPEIGLVMVVLAGNYNDPDAWKLPVDLMERFVAPAVRARLE